MKTELSGVVKNSLFAMVDLFLEFVIEEEASNVQKGNISEFITDCHNLKQGEPEFDLLQAKFQEEFENDSNFYDMNKKDLHELMEYFINRLVQDKEIPLLILNALNESDLEV